LIVFSIVGNNSVAASFSGIIEGDENSLHARYGKFIEPFCGPATKNLNGYIWWLEVRMRAA
jgi:hypothetical protein